MSCLIRSIFLSVIVLGAASPQAGALTGNEWPQFPSDASPGEGDYAYIYGMVDAWRGALKDDLDKLKPGDAPVPVPTRGAVIALCIKNNRLNYGQVAAIVKQYRSEHPETLNREMFETAAEAMIISCGKMGK